VIELMKKLKKVKKLIDDSTRGIITFSFFSFLSLVQKIIIQFA